MLVDMRAMEFDYYLDELPFYPNSESYLPVTLQPNSQTK